MRFAPQFDFKLSAIVRKRRNWYLAICPPLDLASQGSTEGKALANLKDAIRGFLADCFERGTITEVLKNAGSVSARQPSLSRRRFPKAHWLTVPIALLAGEHATTRTYKDA